MRCPKCGGSQSSVVDSRQAEDGNTIRRQGMRRMPLSLYYLMNEWKRDFQWSSKKMGHVSNFRDKILMVLSAQLKKKRPVSSDEIEEIVNRLNKRFCSQSDNENQQEYIGSLADELADLDEITYVRFVSVYRSFQGCR